MESTFYTAKEAAAFLEVSESEIYQLVAVEKTLRPILFFDTPPPFKEETFYIIETESKSLETLEYDVPIAKGEIRLVQDQEFDDRLYGYISVGKIEKTIWPSDYVERKYYAIMGDVDGEITTKNLGPIFLEDECGNELAFEIKCLHLIDYGLPGHTIFKFGIISKDLFLAENTNWIFTQTELEKVKYGKTLISEVAKEIPISGRQTTQRIELIEREMSLLGIDPKAIENIPGKSGPKASIKKKLLDTHPSFFPKSSKFDDAWRYALRVGMFKVKK